MSIPTEPGWRWWRLNADYDWWPRELVYDANKVLCEYHCDIEGGGIEWWKKAVDIGGEWGERIPTQDEYVQIMHELAITKRALEMACESEMGWYDADGGSCPKHMDPYKDCEVAINDRNPERCADCGGEFLRNLYTRQARKEVKYGDRG